MFFFFFFNKPRRIWSFFHSAAIAVLFLRWKKEGIFLLTPEDVADGNVNVAAVQQLDHMEDVGVSPQRRREFHTFTLRCCARLFQNSLPRFATTGMESALDLDIRADHMI